MGHRDILGNCIADELTKAETKLVTYDILVDLEIPISLVQCLYIEAQHLWQQKDTCGNA